MPIIIDDGDPSFAPARLTAIPNPIGWSKVSGSGHAGDHALHSHGVAQGPANFARWTMTPPSSVAPVSVFATWVPLAGNAQNATYHIYNGNALLDTVAVDQQQPPVPDIVVGATPFQKLGEYTFTFNSLTVRLITDAANGNLVADAIAAT